MSARKRFDRRVCLLQQEAELVDAVQQAVAREGLERKLHGRAVGQRERASLASRCCSSHAGIRQQPGVRLLVDDDRQQAVLERVAAEDVGDLGADHGVEAEVQQRPGRVLARGAAAEVAAGDEDRAARGLGLFSTKSGFGAAVGVVAPVGEQPACQAFLAWSW